MNPTASIAQSWYEASARVRVQALLDRGSFAEFIGPERREASPHLPLFDLPRQFDDGIVVGAGKLGGTSVLVAAQEGRFMGGAFGEVHGAKLTGLLRAATSLHRPVLLALDTGGVRLQEANAGEIAISEIMRAIMEVRAAGVPVVALIGGRAGCYGGGGLIAACCSAIVISEPGRLSVSGPEVIETNHGVEEFDARDRALIWRTMGGKHRYLIGAADVFVEDDAQAFRAAAITMVQQSAQLNRKVLLAEQSRLEKRLARFGNARDGREVWAQLGVADAAQVPELDTGPFLALAAAVRESAHEAR